MPSTMVVFHRTPREALTATRMTVEDKDDYLVLSVTPKWIIQTFGSRKEALHPGLQDLLHYKTSDSSALAKVRSLSLAEKEIAAALITPPVVSAARSYWYLAKVLEILTHHLFPPINLASSEPFCSKIKRIDRERSDACIAWLKERLDEPLNLNDLARHIGCAPHYLSRQFKKSTGLTLKQQHRALRIDHAATLLSEGDYNVTEAAMEVGYNSLSHFSKAFMEEKGCLPSDFLND
ncbi:helix-turn-helix transcriptional regulator [Rubritalea tangerina]|uniref:Helix-turn-helix transcriptional regulator n=2 Tax=Rubritalea tangerina TaxID=430798 RepID=A0ABW4ZAE6_9BACT